eukprot:PhF_6_TR29823/c0_g1_i1/m.43795/K15441/TAD2, ADAT2; tRNA-specific adenosine deaminase 2
MDYNEIYMNEAFVEARKALECGEVAVGCVLVHRREGTIIARGHNLTNTGRDATLHAELVAAQSIVPPPCDLSEYALYVTVEPCIMCAAALGLMNIGVVYYGCRNDRFGGNGSVLSLHEGKYLSHGGYRAEESVSLLKHFYSGENTYAPEER